MSKNDRAPMPAEASIITTYRCPMKCKMCHIWKNPTQISREIKPSELEILPKLKSINITGGEPFARRDLEDIVEVCFRKAPRVVISSSGYAVDETLALADKFPNIGIRISIEGLSTINDHLRGRDSGFDRGLKTLLGLRRKGVKDIGFGITVSNNNSNDMLELYELAKNVNMEFATATYHNSAYFHKDDNELVNKDEVTDNFYELIDRLLSEKKVKSWFRAFFNMGLINYIEGKPRLLPCEAGTTNFFIDPYGEVYPCNGLEERYWKERMGNIREVDTFEELWYGEEAEKVRSLVKTCPKNCWMIGTAAPVMKKYIKHPVKWVLKHKIGSLLGKKVKRGCLPDPYPVGQDPRQGDLREPEKKSSGKQKRKTAAETSPTAPESTREPVLVKDDNRLMTRVIDRTQLPNDVFRLRMERRAFDFIPGQNVAIGQHLKYHQTRDYTIVSPADVDYLEFLIKVIPGGLVSPELAKLEPGDDVDIIGPYGEFLIDSTDTEKSYIFAASGIGVGAFESFVKSYDDLDYTLIHGVRNLEDLQMADGFDADRYVSCVTQEEGGSFFGRITDYLKTDTLPANKQWYLCGNPHMVKEVGELLEGKNVPADQVFTEHYYAY